MGTRTLLLAAGLALSGALHAQPTTTATTTTSPAATPEGRPVSFAQALDAARANLDVSLARRALAAARADIATADHAPAPVFSAKASSIDLQNGIGGGNLLRDKRIDKSVGIDWTLERGNKRELRTRGAQLGADAAAFDLAEATTQQQLAAASAFYDLLAAQERIAQVEAMSQSATQLADSAARRLRAGDISQQDAARTEIEAQRSRADLRTAQADRQRAALALSQLTGISGPLRADATWPTAAAPAAGALPAIDARPDVQAAERRVQAAQAALDAATALRRNDVTIGSSIDHFPGTSTRQLEVRMSVPLAGVLGTYGFEGEIGRARAQLEQAQDQLEKTRRAAAAETQRLREDLEAAAVRALSYHEVIVPRARQVAAGAELAFNKGAMPLTDLIDARRTLRAVLLEETAARADHARALAAWQLRTQPAQP